MTDGEPEEIVVLCLTEPASGRTRRLRMARSRAEAIVRLDVPRSGPSACLLAIEPAPAEEPLPR